MAVLFSDSFNRADNSSSLGAADLYNGGSALAYSTGQTFSSSATWGISNNQAYTPTSQGNAKAYVNVGKSDNIKITGTLIGADTSLVIRYNAENSYFAVSKGVTGTGLYLRKSAGAGDWTNLGNGGTIPTATPTTASVELTGSSIKVYENGVLVFTVTDSSNSTNTKHGFMIGSNTASRIDNFQIEDLGGGTPTGTDGSTSFDLKQTLYSDSFMNADSKQSIYQDNSLNIDTKQSIYADSSFNSDMRNVLYSDGSILNDSLLRLYQDSSVQTDTKQAIYSDSATGFDTRLNLYQDGSTLFDTLQEFFSDGIVGSTPFDMRFVLYADSQSAFDSSQAVYVDGTFLSDLEQSIYQASQFQTDMKLVLYSDSSTGFDSSIRTYSDAFTLFDTKQTIFDEDHQIIGTIHLKGNQVLNVYLVGEQSLMVNIQGEQSLNVKLKGVIQ